MGQTKGIFRSLFDFSFTTFIASRIIKILYVLSIVVMGIISIILIKNGFNFSIRVGMLALFVGAPLVFLLGIIYSRVIFEIIIVLFRIAEHTARIAEQGQRSPSSPSDNSC